MVKHPAAKFECVKCGYSEYRMSAKEIGEIVSDDCPKCHHDMRVIESGILPPPLAKVEEIIDKRFEIIDFVAVDNRMEFEVETSDTKKSFIGVLRALKSQRYVAALRERKGELRLQVIKLPEVKRTNVAINILLLIATIGTTLLAGYFLGGTLTSAFLFSVSIMLILGIHELGHKIAAKKHGIESTPPYFIPVPPIPFPLGTLGAVIRIKSPIPTKEALVEMGMSGPMLGFLVALPITAIGLMISGPTISFPIPFVPLAFGLMRLAIPGPLIFNPLLFAGWVGMLVTMLNLLPAGQLDGGHVARGLLSREQHYTLTRTLGFTLIFFGMWLPFLLIWGLFILLLFRDYHMGALDDVSELSKHQRNLSIAAFLVFLLCIPIPPY